METRTQRLGLVRYSSGDDSPSREDWTETIDAIERSVAIDRGTVTTPTPVVDQKPRRLTFRDWGAAPPWWGSSALRTLWRTDDDLTDWPVGGPVHPRRQDFRALDSQPVTGAAWRVSHPDRTAGPTVETRYDGSSRWAGRLAVHDPNWDPTNGRNPAAVHVGSDAAAAADHLGRVYVRTLATGDRGVVIHPHAHDAGPALTVREPGSADMWWVDPFGRTRSKTATAIGGSELDRANVTRVLTASPSTDPDGVGGVLVHGRSTRAGLDPFTVRRYEPDASNDVALLRVGTRDVEVGASAHPDVDARLRLSAPQIVGQGEWRQYFAAADRSDSAVSTMRAMGLSIDSSWATVPMSLDNRGAVSGIPLSVRAMTANNGVVAAPRLAVFQAVRPGAAVERKTMAHIDASGAAASNASWRSNEADRPVALRDVRQSIRHNATQRWVLPGHFGLYQGPRIDPGDRWFTFYFPVMRVRSITPTQLYWQMRLEVLTYAANPPFQGLDRVVVNTHFLVSVNNGSYVRTEPPGWEQEAVGMTTSPVSYVPGDSSTWVGQWMNSLQPGDTFRIACTVRNSDGLGPMRLRRADIVVDECIVENYPQPDPQPLGHNLTEDQRQAGIWAPN